METSNGSEFLASCRMMDRLGPSIFWIPILIEEAEGPVLVRTLVVVLGVILTVFYQLESARSLPSNLSLEDH